MSATLSRLAPPTAASVGLGRFLALGAVVGAVGWSTTALLAARPGLVSDPLVLSVALWAVLVAVMVGVGTLLTPDPVRFSRPMLVWGPVNALATLATGLALLDVLPPGTTPVAWTLAGLVGYAASARFTAGTDRRLYATAAALELGALLAATALAPAGVYVLLGVCHALPLALVVTTGNRLAPYVLAATWLLALSALLLG